MYCVISPFPGDSRLLHRNAGNVEWNTQTVFVPKLDEGPFIGDSAIENKQHAQPGLPLSASAFALSFPQNIDILQADADDLQLLAQVGVPSFL